MFVCERGCGGVGRGWEANPCVAAAVAVIAALVHVAVDVVVDANRDQESLRESRAAARISEQLALYAIGAGNDWREC